MIKSKEEFLQTNLKAVIISPDLARQLVRETKNQVLKNILESGKKIVLVNGIIEDIKNYYNVSRPVGRPRIEEDLSQLQGAGLLRAKNRIWKRNSRKRLSKANGK